jgi:hypothetical protein
VDGGDAGEVRDGGNAEQKLRIIMNGQTDQNKDIALDFSRKQNKHHCILAAANEFRFLLSNLEHLAGKVAFSNLHMPHM